MNNLFNRLFRYKPNDNITPSENFITESFVHLLDYSLLNETPFLQTFINKIGIPIDIYKAKDIFIDTQRQFETSIGLNAIPDLCIQIDSELFVFEIKYGAPINTYSLPHKPDSIINQIEKYQAIKTNQKLYLYTIVLHSSMIDFNQNCPDFKKELYWHDIYMISKDYQSEDKVENYLHNELTKFMEDNRMAIPKVSYELVNGMQSLLNLYEQIEIVFEKLNIPYNTSFGYNFTGYYMFKDDSKKDKYFAWIGTYWEIDKLTFLFSDSKAQENIVLKKREKEFERQQDNKIFCRHFYYEKEHYFCLSAQEQIQRLEKWISQNYNDIVELSK